MKSSLKTYQKTLPSSIKSKKTDAKPKTSQSKLSAKDETPKSQLTEILMPEKIVEPVEVPMPAQVQNTNSDHGKELGR